MARQFYTTLPDSGKLVMMEQGVNGYRALAYDIENGQEQIIDRLNKMNGNSEKDVQIALSCSMFGWDTPKAKELS